MTEKSFTGTLSLKNQCACVCAYMRAYVHACVCVRAYVCVFISTSECFNKGLLDFR